MTDHDYLHAKLTEQTLVAGSTELKELERRGAEVQQLLEEHFSNCSPTIKYGGSKAKGTMIKAAYDLDIICYFPRDDEDAGGTLKDIYENTEKALQQDYLVVRKPSALRLKGKTGTTIGLDFHIDVVPGRYIDGQTGDVYLYQSAGDKERLKTNLEKHISHVKGSGVVDAIRLAKLWRYRNGLAIKHFALELLVIDLLTAKKAVGLADQLRHVWTKFRDEVDGLTVTDPANEEGNDLSDLLNAGVRDQLSTVARTTLELLAASGWEAVFGNLEGPEVEEGKGQKLAAAVAAVSTPTRPWLPL